MKQLTLYQKLRIRFTRCPNCGGRMVPILYGMPSPSTVEKAQREKKFILGGSVFDSRSPIAQCPDCNTALFRDYTIVTTKEENLEYLSRIQNTKDKIKGQVIT